MIAWAATSPRPRARTTVAPRSQRSSTRDRAAPRPAWRTAATRRPLATVEDPAPAVRRTWSTDWARLLVSVSRRELFTTASLAPNRAATLAAFDEHPASLSRRA